MARDRDVAAFGERAQGYDEGWRGRMHHQIADRTADLALTCVPAPRRILDVGCGTGVGAHVIPQGFDQVIPQVLAVFLF